MHELRRPFDLFIAGLALLGAYVWSLPYFGPAYLSDEVAYLTNAAVLAGYRIDGVGSWHAGYGVLIAPFFFFQEDPYHIWRAVMVVNAILLGVTVLITGRVLDTLAPDLDRFHRNALLLMVVLYPAFSVMTGYAYASALFVPLFVATALLLCKTDFSSAGRVVVLGVVVGLLYWVHPIALAALIAALLVVLLAAGAQGHGWHALLFAAVALGMIWLYGVTHDWLHELATPEGRERQDHYGTVGWRLSRVLNPDGLARVAMTILGQASYSIISSYGLVLIGVCSAIVVLWHRIAVVGLTAVARDRRLLLSAFSVLSLLGALGIGAVSVSLGTRTDYAIYGRYSDMFALPVLALGAVSIVQNRRKSVYLWLMLPLIAGAVLHWFGVKEGPHSYQSTVAYWPQYIYVGKSYLIWMTIGVVGVALFLLLARLGRVGMVGCVALMAISLAVVAQNDKKDHTRILDGYSRPSGIVDVIRQNYTRGTCVAFDHSTLDGLTLAQRERFRLYLFYLFDYRYQRMSAEEWRSHCDGPLLTYQYEEFWDNEEVRILAREWGTGLYLVTRMRDALVVSESVDQHGTLYISASADDWCVVGGCFSVNGDELARYSTVGGVAGSGIATDGRAGYLLYGPYKPIRRGHYFLDAEVDVEHFGGATIDVVSARGRTVHVQGDLSDFHYAREGRVRVPFSVDEDVMDLEIRVAVTESSSISVGSYVIRHNDHTWQLPVICRPPKCLERRVGIGEGVISQVGMMTSGGIASNGNGGFLFYGPYVPMSAGDYRLVVSGSIRAARGAWVDIVAESGGKSLGRFELNDAPVREGILIEEIVEIPETVGQLEVRAFVSEDSDLEINAYRLEPSSGADRLGSDS